MDYDDGTDLLGNKEMPVLHPPQHSLVSLRSLLYLTIVLCFALALKFATTDGRAFWKTWQERHYKLAFRRRYGIPDDDNSPFNVAYQRAMQRKEDEKRRAQERSRPQPPPPIHEGNETSKNYNIAPSTLRHRAAPPQPKRNDLPFNQVKESGSGQSRSFGSKNLPSSSNIVHAGIDPFLSDLATSKFPLSQNDRASGSSIQKHAFPSLRKSTPESDVDDSGKAPRNDAVEMVDVDAEEDAMDLGVDTALEDQSPKRGSKRQAVAEEDAVDSPRKKSGKRVRRVSKKSQGPQSAVENEEQDQLMDLDPVARGKKRDRAEAGSTFGGDEDSPGQGRKSRRRKRKSSSHVETGSENHSRGTKRSFELESTLDSDEEYRVSHVKSSRKRGKPMLPEVDDSTDVSFEEPSLVKDPTCGGRKVGEEWEVNGQLFKVGPDGQRLRQVLVKKRRSRFSMPVDSTHPDSQAQMVVLVEKWLNDDDFKAAEERGDIFSPKKEEPEEVSVVEDLPPKTGKQLLWTSPQKAVKGRQAFKDSIVTNVGLNVNPFERPAYTTYNRRVSTGHDAFKLSLSGSPSLRQSKSYSKWEKQDLEAEALARLRKKLEEERKAASPDPKKVTFQLPGSGSAPSIVSSFSAPAGLTSTTRSEKPNSSETKPSTHLFAHPSVPVVSGDSTKPPASSSSDSAPKLFAPPVSKGPSSSTDQPNQPAFPFPPIQPSKDAAPQAHGSVGFSHSSSQPQGSSDLKGPSTTNPSQPSATIATAAIPSFSFGNNKNLDIAGNAAGSSVPNFSPFGTKPVSPSPGAPPVSSTPSAFSIKGAAQSDKPGTPASNPTSVFPTSSAFAPFTAGTGAAAAARDSPKPLEPVAGGPNLLSRVGGFPGGTASGMTNNATGAVAPPPFSFAPPKQVETPSASDKTPAQGSAAAASTTPKFNFGFAARPATSTPTAATPSPQESKPAPGPPVFKLNVTPPSQASSTASATNEPSAAPKSSFSFGQAGGTAPTTLPPQSNFSAFGASNNTPSTSSFNPPSSNAPTASKFSFNFGGAGTGTFGSSAKPALATPSPFGTAAKATDVPKPLFGFGSGSSPQPSPTAAPEKQDKPAFSFNFGGTPSGTSQTSAFGAQSSTAGGPSTFGGATFGGAGGASAGSNVFGNKPAGGVPTPSFGTTPSSGNPSSIFGAPSVFGSQPNSNNGQK